MSIQDLLDKYIKKDHNNTFHNHLLYNPRVTNLLIKKYKKFQKNSTTKNKYKEISIFIISNNNFNSIKKTINSFIYFKYNKQRYSLKN